MIEEEEGGVGALGGRYSWPEMWYPPQTQLFVGVQIRRVFSWV